MRTSTTTIRTRAGRIGLPIVPPTEDIVRELLRWTDRDPREIVAVLPPRQGEATIERIAINAVMAGCRPEYLPVIIAALGSMADPVFNLDSIQATTHPVAPLVIVNGPIAREIGLNAGGNAFGQGFRANITIGRAVRLVLMNVGGGLPGTGTARPRAARPRSPTASRRTKRPAPGSRCTSSWDFHPR